MPLSRGGGVKAFMALPLKNTFFGFLLSAQMIFYLITAWKLRKRQFCEKLGKNNHMSTTHIKYVTCIKSTHNM